MQKFYIIYTILFTFCVCGCSSKNNTTNVNTNGTESLLQRELNSTDPTGDTIIPSAPFGNARIAFLTTKEFKKPSPVKSPQFLGISNNKSLSTVLIHKSNKKHLKLESGYNGYDYKTEIPLSGFQYIAKSLPLTINRSIVIVEDELMGELLEMAKNKVAFFSNAKTVSESVVNQKNWPIKDTILIEKNGKYFALEKPANLKSGAGRAYRSLKLNILSSRSYGYIVQIITVRKSRRK